MRDSILDGNLDLPGYHKFVSALGKPKADLARSMFRALWNNYLKNKGSISLPYWADKFNDHKITNRVLISLSNAGWIVSHAIPARNWGEAHINENKLLEYVTMDELEQVRAHLKFRKYIMTSEPSIVDNEVRINGSIKATGIQRPGFTASGNCSFSFDNAYMEQYETAIQKNLTKSMDKIAEFYPELRHDRATYDSISIDVLDFMIHSQQTYTSGPRTSDSRGRDIHGMLSKIANPVSNKDFRALLVLPN